MTRLIFSLLILPLSLHANQAWLDQLLAMEKAQRFDFAADLPLKVNPVRELRDEHVDLKRQMIEKLNTNRKNFLVISE